MYSKAIEAELTLQKLIEENESLKEKIKQIEEEEKQNQYNEKADIINNDDINCEEVDINIFKKIQDQMNKRAKILDETLSKYTPITDNSKNILSTFKSKYNHHQQHQSSLDNIENNKNDYDILIDINTKYQSNKQIDINSNDDESEYEKSNENNNTNYQTYIYKIPSILLDNKIEEIGLYVRLELSYQKLASTELRINFITLLKQVLNNIIMLKQTCFTVFLQLFNFLITLLSFELSKHDQDSEIISNLQSIGEFVLINKDLSEVLRIIIVMIKRFFPTTFKVSMEKNSELHLRILLFYLKKLTILIKSSHIHISEVFSEVNDFLYSYPPSLLTNQIANINLYLEIYQEIRAITDKLIESNSKDRLIDAIAYVKNKNSTPSDEYLKYLEYRLLKR